MATPEAEHFAALLKELKGRSGRSYGVLAGRLHVSTSTLHRYCNGDAVPNEYAPVERFARLCGATGDELVELHRRWIVADAARRRPAGAGVVAPAPAPAPASAPVPAPAAVASAPVVPDPEPVVPESSAAGVAPAEVPVADAVGGGRSPWARLSRRTRVLIAAAGVAALLVPTSVVAADLVGARAEGGAAAPGRGERAGDDTFFPPATTSPGPSGSPDSAAPSGDPSPSGSADESADEPSGEPSAEPSADEPPEDDGSAAPGTGLGAPPAVTLSSYNWEEPCGQFYLLNRGPEGVDPPPPPQDRRGWARKYGGVEGGNTLLQLTVQGTVREAVVLKGLYVRVVSRKSPPPWSAYLMGNGCGSSIVPQTFASDLDTGHPVITPVPGTQGDRTLPARPFPFKVSSEDVEVLNLDMKAAGYDVTWYLELKWSSGGREGMLRIDDHGKPFRTSGMRGRPAYAYGNDEVKWEPYQAG
ncbi:transcriptional regulator [Kitasatospora albolonga]|uniref:Transcriptional regulator n=1 Tax=Kitasatospora albolonga TaxID=68173 RepID=A0ABC8C386_9ACTN|nr:transcriptional regulator [Kitasatospora albolonga]